MSDRLRPGERISVFAVPKGNIFHKFRVLQCAMHKFGNRADVETRVGVLVKQYALRGISEETAGQREAEEIRLIEERCYAQDKLCAQTHQLRHETWAEETCRTRKKT